ncbi:putative L-type lectin-domain containing receptor kinase VIII.2 [Iris pallida]|uniref:non-specific serine/threonine protein kinase n=1 Tax=Iris pallida TaxID=29817 RepID=A0AAX6G7G8_IRIPA|nr:putative L-type lectin-domain containing receptor kinase VIII.2 [Iris pallida]
MLLLTILFISLHLSSSSSAAASAAGSAVKFDFGSLSLSRLVLLGDAHLLNGSIRLTSDLAVPSSSAGRALYSLPVRPSRPFSTFFSFSISLLNPSSLGAGLSFLLSPDPHSLGDAGPFLGVLNNTSSSPPTIAVEFDTLMDVAFHDINGNHVGVDVNSMVSSSAADLDLFDIDLKSGDLVNAWIEYTGAELDVFVSYSTLRPPDPVLSYPIDLAAYFPGLAYVGFSAATQGSTEVHSIEWWSFSSTSSSSSAAPAATPPPPPPSSASPPPPAPSTFNVSSQPPPPAAPLLVPAPESPRNDSAANSPSAPPAAYRKRPAPAAFAGVASAGALLVLACAGVGFWIFFTRRRRKLPANNNLEAAPSALVNGPKEFSYRQLSLATQSFDSGRVIGHGAFGTVYKGIIPETGAMVAVKRCIRNTDVGRAEFLSELSIIAGLRHRNLLRLQGWCHDRGEILLVYDYMRHGSLDKALFDPPGSSPPLPWQHRKRILLGVASALAYLHRECERKVIHRDVKSSNVMLDEGYNARLGDFGLARQLDHDASPDATITAGTMGYLAPEYLLTGRATEKTDVFSFGAVVLEVACGRRPIEGPSKRYTNLVEWVWGLHGEGRLLEAVDGRLEGEFDEGEVRKVMLVGLACSNPDPVMRPGMRGVVQMLSGETEPPVVPVAKPAMTVGTNDQLLLNLQDSVSDYNALGLNLYSSGSSTSDSLESTLRGGVGRASSGSRG